MYMPLLLPALIVYVVLFIVPALYGMTLSFASWAGLGSAFHWVGVKNYVDLFTSPVFLSSFWNTLVLTAVVGVAIFLVSCGAMIVLRSTKGHSFIRSAVFVPYIISPIAIGLSVSFLFNPKGMINTLLGLLGLDGLQRPWLAPENILQVIMVGLTWSAAGFYVVLLMSAVDAIPASLYESAQIEGANLLQQFRHITLPLTRDMISVAAVLWVIAGIKTFEIIIAFTGTAGTPPLEARSLAVEQYLRVTGGPAGGIPQLGSAAAIGVIMTAITVVLILLSRRISRREALEM
ncbi:carbohydrate ABC transporter permease [Humibacter ginsenosidimutans]|uniref:Sugar ABC transporter permease n=1 Tax=Humibacter ginsenosidimutans TaxID=2599293 RepID=A0A5B8M660_9MICO|nr:sugar ABC transporter permease [Humibacter ginsenosidimutans]QDZ15833.1 sugar ABC transporter permease [Humibacter ginsenosidimutans]